MGKEKLSLLLDEELRPTGGFQVLPPRVVYDRKSAAATFVTELKFPVPLLALGHPKRSKGMCSLVPDVDSGLGEEWLPHVGPDSAILLPPEWLVVDLLSGRGLWDNIARAVAIGASFVLYGPVCDESLRLSPSAASTLRGRRWIKSV